MKTATRYLLLVFIITITPPVTASDYRGYRDYAPVLNVEPVMRTRIEPVTHRVCNSTTQPALKLHPLAPTIGLDVRRQQNRWQAQQYCHTVTENRRREHIDGYRVTYRYHGHTATTRLSYDPGDRIPVDISLTPDP